MKSNSAADGARNLIRTLCVLSLCGILAAVLSSCGKDDPEGSPTAGAEPSEADPKPQTKCEFIKFDQAEGNGRCADFKLTNESDRALVGVRGMILGYDSGGAEVYTFPWGSSALPQLVGARSEVVIDNAGFEIPPEVVRVEYEIEEVDTK